MQKAALGVAVVALIVSGIALFRGGSAPSSAEGEMQASTRTGMLSDTSSAPAIRVAFVRGDSINLGYRFISDMQDELITSSKKAEGKLQRSLEKAEKEYADLMKYVQSGQATQDEMAIAEQRIMQLQMELQQMEQQEQIQLAREEQEMQVQINTRLNEFLADYAKRNNIDLILNRGVSGEGVLYGAEAFDVTADVLRELNAAYELEKNPIEQPK